MKTCSKCGETKPRSGFGKRTASRDGLHPCCRTCKRAYEADRKAGKQCGKCNRLRPRSRFGKLAASSDGLHSYCNDCKRDYESNHRRSKPDMERAKRKRYREGVKRREAEAWAYVGK